MSQVILLAKNAEQLRIETYGRAVAEGVAANTKDFLNPVPKPEDVKTAIDDYVNSIKPVRDQSVATNEITENKRKTAMNLVNQLIKYADYTVDGNEEILRNANIELRKKASKKDIGKLEIQTSRMGSEPGSFYFRLASKAGANVIGVFRKDADGEFRIVDAFSTEIMLLKNQPSGDQTYLFKGKKGNNDWDEASVSSAVTVRVP